MNALLVTCLEYDILHRYTAKIESQSDYMQTLWHSDIEDGKTQSEVFDTKKHSYQDCVCVFVCVFVCVLVY